MLKDYGVHDVLESYFNDLTKRLYHSNLSWENCYKFFCENHEKILEDGEKSEICEIAALHLAFYLASWGMYRGSAFIRRYDHNIYKGLIIELLSNCENLWKKDVEWSDLKKANEIITNYFIGLKKDDKSTDKDKHSNRPTQTLITKILMGIFACVPAYDRYVIKALKAYNICQTYKEDSYNEIKKWLEERNYNYKLSKSEVEYTPMKLIDVYFWSVGKDLEEKEKINNK